MTAANAPRVWTGDALLDRALFLAGFKQEHLRHALARDLEALDAVVPEKRTWERNKAGELELTKREEGGAPDHPVRLRAAENLFDWVGFKGKREREGGTGKPVQVTINLTAAPEPRPELPRGRLAIHLDQHGPANSNGGNGAH